MKWLRRLATRVDGTLCNGDEYRPFIEAVKLGFGWMRDSARYLAVVLLPAPMSSGLGALHYFGPDGTVG
jgi:hypothetical protein